MNGIANQVVHFIKPTHERWLVPTISGKEFIGATQFLAIGTAMSAACPAVDLMPRSRCQRFLERRKRAPEGCSRHDGSWWVWLCREQ